ncbi:MAG: hypothetical protein ICV64_10205 [Thermoleophilia bacterium]|nr:hypothetical protein [Thermoleophilia bacterium]
MAPIYAATGDTVVRVEDGRAEVVLRGSGRCLAVRGELALAGDGDGVRVSTDGLRTWERTSLEADVYSVAVATDGTLYAGSEPSMLFTSRDSGATWRELRTLRELPSQPTWSFPPRPWTSHVRWIAPAPDEPARLLVGIELGGLMLSEDGGETWHDHRPGAQKDVHSLAWHPSGVRAYEAGGGGAASSDDRGRTWTPADDGRDRHYTWSVAPDPADPDTWFVSASTGPFAAHGGRDAQARIFRRRGTAPWQALTDELQAMPYALAFDGGGSLYAGLSDGRMLVSRDRGDTWDQVALAGDMPRRISALVAA